MYVQIGSTSSFSYVNISHDVDLLYYLKKSQLPDDDVDRGWTVGPQNSDLAPKQIILAARRKLLHV